MGALGLLALFIRANFSLICNTPRDGVFPDRVKIKITISHQTVGRLQLHLHFQVPGVRVTDRNQVAAVLGKCQRCIEDGLLRTRDTVQRSLVGGCVILVRISHESCQRDPALFCSSGDEDLAVGKMENGGAVIADVVSDGEGSGGVVVSGKEAGIGYTVV